MSLKENPGEVFTKPIQIGVLVRDLDKTLENLENIFGIGPFRIVDYPPEGEDNLVMEYNGEPADFTAKFCFFDLGNIELELIQPLSGKTVWSDYLDRHGDGIHHIKFDIPRHDELKEYMDENGVAMTQSGSAVGKNAGKTWAYYGTEDLIGFAIEVMNRLDEKA